MIQFGMVTARRQFLAYLNLARIISGLYAELRKPSTNYCSHKCWSDAMSNFVRRYWRKITVGELGWLWLPTIRSNSVDHGVGYEDRDIEIFPRDIAGERLNQHVIENSIFLCSTIKSLERLKRLHPIRGFPSHCDRSLEFIVEISIFPYPRFLLLTSSIVLLNNLNEVDLLGWRIIFILLGIESVILCRGAVTKENL